MFLFKYFENCKFLKTRILKNICEQLLTENPQNLKFREKRVFSNE